MIRWYLALCVVIGCSLPARAHADDLADEADLQFQLGTEAYTRADYRQALEHFLRSNGLVHNRNVIFNIARCYEQLGQYPSAWRSYRRALDQTADEAFRKKVSDALGRIAPFVGIIEIQTDPPGATVYIDRKDLGARGEAPLPLGLAPGKYEVFVEKPGYEPARSGAIEVAAGQTRALSLVLKPIFGQVRVEGTAGAEVHVDREDAPAAGRIPMSLPVTVGAHTIFVTAPGMKTDEFPVEVRADAPQVVRAKLDARLGSLVVDSDLRDALIEVDARPVGFSPAVVSVPVGLHRVRVSLSGFAPVERTAIIAEQKQTRLRVALAQGEQVSAVSRTEEQIDKAPSSVTIISREELRAMGYQTIAEAVRGVRGLYLTDDRSYTTIGVRGVSQPGDYGNKILILYDGHPYNENILGQSFPGLEGRSDLDDVERIEVVRGPGSVLYGTGAFFGVINLVTHGPNEKTRLEASAAAHEYGVTRGRAFGYFKFPGGAIWTSASAFRGAGRDFYFQDYRTDPSGLGGNARDIDDVHGGTLQGRVWWRDFTLQWLWHQRVKTLPTGEYDTIFGDSRNVFDDRRGFVELRFEPKLGSEFESMTRAHGNIYDFYSTAPYTPDNGGLVKEKYHGRWVGLEQRFTYHPRESIRLTLGAEAQRHFRASLFGSDQTGSVYLPEDLNRYWVLGVYGASDADLTSFLRVSAGVRYDAFRWQFSAHDVTSSAIDPRVALIFRPYASGVTKLIGGKAFRAPSIYERFYQSSVQKTSLDLQPEQVWTGEIEHTHHFSSAVLGVGSVFTNYVKDLVVGRGEGTEASPLYYVNSSTPVLTYGAEAELRREWREGWMVAANYTFQHTAYVKPAAEDNLKSGAHVPNSPVHLASVKGAVPIIGRTLSAMTRITYAGPRYDRNETRNDPPQATTASAVVWDLVLSGRVMNERVHYNLGAYNIADYRYSAPVSAEFRMNSVVQNGRTLLAAVSVTVD